MARSGRLLDLIQILRRHRRPVTGRALADELGISLRTLYRDIATLQGQGAAIEGEAGLGYVLRPGFLLPPLMFSDEEIEALVLGARFVHARGDGPLATAAGSALARIAAVLPPDLRDSLETSSLIVGPGATIADAHVDIGPLRRAIRAERKVDLAYADGDGATTRRTVRPIALAFFDKVRILVAWCELRQDFRSFRVDRIADLVVTDVRPPRRRAVLLKEWRQREGIREPGL